MSHTGPTTSKTLPPTKAQAAPPLSRPFHLHLGSVSLANLADGILAAGVPLIAVQLSRSPQEISLLQVAFWLPWLLLGLVAGMIIDRTDRRKVRIAGMLARVVLLAVVAAVAWSGHLSIWMLILFMGLYGVTQVFVDLAGRAMIPQVAPRSRLASANSRILAAERVFDEFLGAPLAGALVLFGATWVLGLPIIICLAAAGLLLVGMRGDYTTAEAQQRSALRQIRDGVAVLVRHPVLRVTTLTGAGLNFASNAYFAVFILWVVGAESAAGLGASQYPLLVVALACGAVTASFCAASLTRRFREVPVMVTVLAVQVALLVVPVFWPHLPIMLVVFFLMGFANMTGNVILLTIRQRVVRTAILGRIGGAASTLGYGAIPLGALTGGVVGEHLGLPAVFLGAAALSAIVVIYPAATLRQHMVDRLARQVETAEQAAGDAPAGGSVVEAE